MQLNNLYIYSKFDLRNSTIFHNKFNHFLYKKNKPRMLVLGHWKSLVKTLIPFRAVLSH
jgi:hypothetical protein